jgi:nucleoside-diphosphate-sugar epimerase
VRLFVTGASGFIGGVLCRQLLEAGHEVHALVRRPGSEPAGTIPVNGDIDDAARLTEVLGATGADCVVHLAAEIASQRSEQRVMQVNVAGTQHLIAACMSAGGGDSNSGPRVVFASTVVTGDAHGALLTEDDPLPVQTPYGRAKQEGERLLLASGLDVSIIRPSHVYGPGGWFAHELLPRLKGPGRFAVVGRGENLWDVVHVEDVAAALVLAASAPPGSVYHVVDDRPISYYDFMALSAAELGVGAPRRIPAALVRMIAGRNAVDALVRSARSSNAKIKRELGWRPRFATASDGVPDVIRALGGSPA